jgi:TolB protein
MTVEPSAPERLTRSLHTKQHLRFTPDGQHLVFSRTLGVNIRLTVIRSNGSEERDLFDGRKDFIQEHPAWSPDGKQLAFTISDGYRTGRIGIFLCTVQGLTFTEFRPFLVGGQYSYPAWSPNGRHLALISSNMRLMVADLNGKSQRLIGPQEGIQGQPSWSPDGRWIAFSSSHQDNYEVYAIHPDGSGLRRITRCPAMNYRPVYSPDGQWLAFTSNRGGNWDLYVMRPDGTGPHQVTSHAGKDDHAAWSPDSRELAFVSTRDGGYDIYRVRLTGHGR